MLLVGTVKGLYELDEDGAEPRAGDGPVADRAVTALAVSARGERWVLADGTAVLCTQDGGSWTQVAGGGAFELTCLLPGERRLLVGAEEARLLELEDISAGGSLEPVESFDNVPGRQSWYTPWGGPPAVRSLARDWAGRLHLNVHVGGIPRSGDGGATWEPTIDIDADAHQVLAHPRLPDVVLAATARGLARSDDGGDVWRHQLDGMHAPYCRAVAVSGDTVLVSASEGPSGRRAALYRALLEGGGGFERCRTGLPEWFDANIDTGCLAADDEVVAFGTADGSLFVSEDSGVTWVERAAGLPAVRAVAFA
jgi:hypothetical protein